jgi:hypothetical protein
MKLRKCTAEAIGTFWLTFGVGCHRNRGPRTLEVNMRPNARTDAVSRRGAITSLVGSLVGLAGVGAFASDAAATAGMVRRQERRAVRYDRRDDRRDNRQDRREARRTPAATGVPAITGSVAPAPRP